MIVTREASPYTENSSPPSFTLNKPASPRDFWSGRDSAMSPGRFNENSENFDENRSPSPPLTSSPRRSSIEKLKQASRVKNSNIFSLETKDAYDPTTLPIVERPSANRPMSQLFEANTFARFDSLRKENNPLRNSIAGSSPERKVGHKRSESQANINFSSPTKSPAGVPLPPSPEKQGSPSPTKSSLARTSQFGFSPNSSFDPENGTWSDNEDRVPTPRALHRHAKSVTFHEEPPVVNEYEQQTPEPSVSAASDREGSWDSDDFDDQDISFDRGSSLDAIELQHGDDSFDQDLENADKTPVVLPEDWSRMSPDEARMDLVNNEDDVFDEEGEPTQRGLPGNEHAQVEQRIASDGSEGRPLPPIPGFVTRERRDSNGLSSAAERVAHTPRNLPSPPKRASVSKDEILNMTSKSSLSLQDRLQLINQTQEDRPSSKSSSSTEHGQPEELVIKNLDTGETVEVQVAETELTQEDSVLADFSAPRISRESILRKVRSTRFDYEDEDDTFDQSEFHTGIDGRPSIAELAKMDPDQPIPSRENSRETSSNYGYGAAAAYLQQEDESVYIKDEPNDEDGIDMSSIPQVPELAPPRSPSRMDDYARDSSVLRHDVPRDSEDADGDSESRYSSVEPDLESTTIQTTQHKETTVEYEDGSKETLQEAMQLLSVKEYGEPKEPTKQGVASRGAAFVGLPEYLGTDDYTFGMGEYASPFASNAGLNLEEQKLDVDAMPELQPPVQPGAEFEQPPVADVSPPGTPDSVIRYDDGKVSPIEAPEERSESDPVPERNSSIKTGGKLRARRSHTQADLETMAEQRRLVSMEQKAMPVPSIPEAYRQEYEDAVNASADSRPASKDSTASQSNAEEKPKERRKPRKSGGRMDLDLGLDTSAFSIGDQDCLGLDSEFERVIEGSKVCPSAFPPPLYARFGTANAVSGSQPQQSTQFYLNCASPSPYSPHSSASAGANVSTRTKKGYLMRQNTKVVVASSRNFSGDSNGTAKSNEDGKAREPPMSPRADARPKFKSSPRKNDSPRKASDEQFLKTEPWNGKSRRQSVRNASVQQQRVRANLPAPPLPGQESAVMSGAIIDEDYAAGSAGLEDDVGEGVERGRLFVKVVGVKDLDLPMPRNDRVSFQLTLDNGLHCVTTSSLELNRSAAIGQEFELVVLNDLEFQLTLTTKLPPPPKQAQTPSSPTKSVKAQKSLAFSRFLISPKKRAEKERQEREAAEAEQKRQQEEVRRKRASQIPTAWDLLHELVNGVDGAFARAYVNLRAHEHACFGRPLSVDIPCYNEWALEQDTAVVNSVRSKRGTNSGPVRRPPYIVGNLELQLLYVPKPRGAQEEDMPKSMSSAIREMKRVSEVKEVVHEGHLSQQGGDCKVSCIARLLGNGKLLTRSFSTGVAASSASKARG